MERLQKILSQAGIASRRASEKLMLEGRVSVNGTTVMELVSAQLAEVAMATRDFRDISAKGGKTAGGQIQVTLDLGSIGVSGDHMASKITVKSTRPSATGGTVTQTESFKTDFYLLQNGALSALPARQAN